MNTLVMLRGGHTTVVKGQSPHDIEHELRSFREGQQEGLCSVAMFYIQTEQRGDNGLCVDPDSIVALVASP